MGLMGDIKAWIS